MADRIKLRRGPKNKIDLNVYELGYITDSDEERLYFNNGSMVPIPNNKDITDIKTELTKTTNISNKNKQDVSELKESVAGIVLTGVAKLVQYSYDIELSETTKIVNIPYEKYSSVTDTLKVYVDGLAIQNDQYTITDPVENEDVIINGYITLKVEKPAGTIVRIEVWKNVPSGKEGEVNGNIIAQNTLPLDRIIGIDTINTQLNYLAKNKTEGKVRFINDNNKSVLGVTFPCTCSELANAMENGDVLFCDAAIISDKPKDYGHIFVIRCDINRVKFQFRSTGGDENNTLNELYIAAYRNMTPENKFSGWSKVSTENDSGWLELPLVGGATTISYDKPLYRKIGNTVYMKGAVETMTSNTVFATLPYGFRPNNVNGGSEIPLVCFSRSDMVKLVIGKNGSMKAFTGENTSLYLDGVMFIVD